MFCSTDFEMRLLRRFEGTYISLMHMVHCNVITNKFKNVITVKAFSHKKREEIKTKQFSTLL